MSQILITFLPLLKGAFLLRTLTLSFQETILVSGGLILAAGALAVAWRTQRPHTSNQPMEETPLPQSEEMLELFFSQSLDGFFFMTLDEPLRWDETVDKALVVNDLLTRQRVTKVNEAMLKQYGATREEFLGITPQALFAHDPEQGRQIFHNLFNAGHLHMDSEERKMDGTPMWIEGDYICTYDAQGRVTGHFGIQRDVTHRREMEKALREAEERWQYALEGTGDGVWDWNVQTGQVYYSRQWKRMLGYMEDEIEGTVEAWEKRVHPDDLAPTLETLNKYLHGLTPAYVNEHRLLCKNGTYKWIMDRGKVVEYTAQGQPQRMIGTHTDITQRKLAEQALQNQQKILYEAQSIANLQSWTADLQTDTFHVGTSKDHILDMVTGVYPLEHILNIVHPADRDHMLTAWAEISPEKPLDVEYRVLDQDEVKWVHVRASIQFDQNGQPSSALGITQDITAHKQTENLIQAQRDLARILGTVPLTASVWPACMEIVLKVSGMDSGGIYLFSEDQQDLDLIYHQGLGEDFVKGATHYPGHAPNVQILLAGTSTYLDVAQVSQRPNPTREGLKSIAILPMQAQGRVWGGINIASHTLKQVPAFARFALETLSTELANIFIHLQTEAKLRESEARYRLLFETMVQGVVFQDAEGQIIHANPSAERILGLTVEEMRGLTSRDPSWGVIHEDGSPFPGETHPAMIALQTGQPVYNVVMGVLNASLNTYRWLHVNAIPRFNPEDHKPYQVYTTFEDITESKEAKNALETSEKKFISLIASQTHYVIRVNMEGKYTYWNAQFEKEFGWLHEPHGFLNANAMLTTCEYHRERVFEVSMQCMANPGQAFSVEIDKPAKGGGVRTTLWEFICLTDEHNQPSEIQCMGMDISDRKRAEEALRRMEMRYRALIENAPDGIVLVTPDGHFKYGSPSVERIFGYVQAQIPELSPNDLTHPDDLPIVLATLYEVIQNPHQTSTLQYRFLHRRGEWRWIESTFSNLLAVPGVEAIAINFTDVTERRQAETALRESEARAQAMLQAIPDLMFRLDREGVFLGYKADVKELYDQSGKSLIGKRNRDIAPPAFAELIDHFIQTTLETGSLQTFEYQLTLPEQGPQVYEARMTPSGPNEVLAIVRNITERKKAEEALRAREELYRLISTINADYIFSTDVAPNGDMTLKWVGGGFETITGYTFDEYLAIGGWRATLHPDDLPIDDQNTATLKNNQKLSSELRTYHKNGQLHWVQVHANPLWDDEHQRLKGVYGTVQDITARKKAETALHLSEEKYRVLLESLDNVIATVNEEGQFLFLNDTAAAQLGGTVTQFTGKTMHELFPPDIATLQMDLVRKTIQENHSQIYETITMIQSQPRWHRTSILPMQDENGNITRALISSTDIHDLKTAQEDLQELNHTLEQRVQQRTAEVQDLYENSPIGYHSLDPHGIIIRINQTHLDWLGYTREEMLGHAFSAFLPPPGVHLFQQVYPPFMQNGSMRDVEFDLLRKDGTIISVLISATGIYDEQGRFIMSRTTVFDNTERKLTNEALRQANLELERSMRLKDEFLANMSHELRTPLNAILAFSEGLLEQYRGPLNEKQLLSVKNIETSGRHLLALITDILDLSKIEAGHLDLQIQDIALADVAEASLLFIKEIASKKNLKLAFHLNDHLAIVEADPKRLKQMLVNLLSNAVKFTPSDGQISLQVTTNPEEKTVTFTVADTGIGIAPEDLPRLFQPFTQLDSSLSRQHEGTGLGLVLVQRLAQLHGGTISVQSIPNKGSQFTITLPYHPPVFPHPTPSHPPHKGVTGPLNAHPATLPNLTPIRILLAEDNDFNTQAIQDYLQDKGYQITTARDGRSAIESAQQTHPHLILMDIQMPEMDGLEAIRQLRATPAFAHTPIIALTALAMPGDRERCLSAGANEYLVKPVSLKDLVETIQIMLADKDFTQ